MYLKSIEVQGFKSFANKIKFDFHNGITGIVGPNGSGKSNVADAVRWVLGEQSAKQLRGANMQDVIFAGTENRKPLSYAYVAITMDNSDHKLAIDFEEVTVARRVYRSGESEYLINGTICRLKDVNELFAKVKALAAEIKDKENELLLFASTFSTRAKLVNSENRAKVHLAAVFACNFTNNLYSIASEILEKAGLTFEDMIPLITETTEKIKSIPPRKAQTGPAIRRDSKVIEKQLNALEGREKEIYKLITESIQDEKL